MAFEQKKEPNVTSDGSDLHPAAAAGGTPEANNPSSLPEVIKVAGRPSATEAPEASTDGVPPASTEGAPQQARAEGGPAQANTAGPPPEANPPSARPSTVPEGRPSTMDAPMVSEASTRTSASQAAQRQRYVRTIQPSSIDEVLTDLRGVECEWDAVMGILTKYELSKEMIEQLLNAAAKAQGFWDLDLKVMKEFRDVLTANWSTVCQDWSAGRTSTIGTRRCTELINNGSMFLGPAEQETGVEGAVLERSKSLATLEKMLPKNVAASQLRQFKIAVFVAVTIQMVLFACYVVFYMTPLTFKYIGFQIVIARGSAYGACFWTALLFLTMSRNFITFLANLPCIRGSKWGIQLLNSYKELHIFSAWEVLIDGFLHTLMHHVGTFIALERHDATTLNTMLVCAQEDKSKMPAGYIGKVIHNNLEFIQFPPCPLPEDADVGYFNGVYSTPGITGYLLLIVICTMGFFSRQKQRKANFRRFYVLHHLLAPAWVILLVLHGANDWVGLGFPLVVLVCGIPLVLYAYTRMRRMYLSCKGSKMVRAEKSMSGKLLRIDVELSNGHHKCEVGQYAYVNVPSLGYTEWHPFTISNARDQNGRQRISFVIMAVGIWTKKLHQRAKGVDDLPAISIDGPYYAPTVSMARHSTVVGVGSGVGVTPFLSFLGEMASAGFDHVKNAHVFWMTNTASDFLIMRDLFSELEEKMQSSGRKLTFHLHAKPRSGGTWDGKGVGSIFELTSQEVWEKWTARLAEKQPELVPTFNKYSKPLHAVVTYGILASGNPVAIPIGSPDFISELLAIGDADPKEHVMTYYCGNPFIQKTIQTACIACNEHRTSNDQPQRYYFTFERFG